MPIYDTGAAMGRAQGSIAPSAASSPDTPAYMYEATTDIRTLPGYYSDDEGSDAFSFETDLAEPHNSFASRRSGGGSLAGSPLSPFATPALNGIDASTPTLPPTTIDALRHSSPHAGIRAPPSSPAPRAANLTNLTNNHHIDELYIIDNMANEQRVEYSLPGQPGALSGSGLPASIYAAAPLTSSPATHNGKNNDSSQRRFSSGLGSSYGSLHSLPNNQGPNTSRMENDQVIPAMTRREGREDFDMISLPEPHTPAQKNRLTNEQLDSLTESMQAAISKFPSRYTSSASGIPATGGRLTSGVDKKKLDSCLSYEHEGTDRPKSQETIQAAARVGCLRKEAAEAHGFTVSKVTPPNSDNGTRKPSQARNVPGRSTSAQVKNTNVAFNASNGLEKRGHGSSSVASIGAQATARESNARTTLEDRMHIARAILGLTNSAFARESQDENNRLLFGKKASEAEKIDAGKESGQSKVASADQSTSSSRAMKVVIATPKALTNKEASREAPMLTNKAMEAAATGPKSQESKEGTISRSWPSDPAKEPTSVINSSSYQKQQEDLKWAQVKWPINRPGEASTTVPPHLRGRDKSLYPNNQKQEKSEQCIVRPQETVDTVPVAQSKQGHGGGLSRPKEHVVVGKENVAVDEQIATTPSSVVKPRPIGTIKSAVTPTATGTLPFRGSQAVAIGQRGESLAAWPTPEKRATPGATLHRARITRLPKTPVPNAAFIAKLVYGGLIERFIIGERSADIFFVDADACKRFCDESANGIVYKKGASPREDEYVLVEPHKEPEILSSHVREYIDNGATRCVHAIGRDTELNVQELRQYKVVRALQMEKVIDEKTEKRRKITFRFCSIQDACTFKVFLERHEDWEEFNVQFCRDPCNRKMDEPFVE